MTAGRPPVPVEHVAVAVVGGGPAGLTTAAALADAGCQVMVIERERELGGIPRHSDHPGFGMRDLRRFVSGPEYSRRLTDRAVRAGADVRVESHVTGWAGERSLLVTSPRGRRRIDVDAVVVATGARERPRTARMIAGDRPDGVLTTGQLQQLVQLFDRDAGGAVGRRAVVVGSELVSWSAVMTLRHAGCQTVAMTTEYDRPEAYAAIGAVGRTAFRVPSLTRTRVVRIDGRPRVESVTVEHLDSGRRATIACDTVLVTADWIPDHELLRSGGVDLDAGTLGPVVDEGLRTATPGVFAAGNVIHPVDTADNAALDGRHVARSVLGWLDGDRFPRESCVLQAMPPLRWVAPQRWAGQAAPRGDLLFWCDTFRRFPRLRARQDRAVIGEVRTPWPMAPGRVFRAPARLVAASNVRGGLVTIELA